MTLTLDEVGTAFCSVVRNGLPHPSRFFVAAEGADSLKISSILIHSSSPVSLRGFQANTSFYQFAPQHRPTDPKVITTVTTAIDSAAFLSLPLLILRPHDAAVLVNMASSVRGLHALERGTDYNVFCPCLRRLQQTQVFQQCFYFYFMFLSFVSVVFFVPSCSCPF